MRNEREYNLFCFFNSELKESAKVDQNEVWKEKFIAVSTNVFKLCESLVSEENREYTRFFLNVDEWPALDIKIKRKSLNEKNESIKYYSLEILDNNSTEINIADIYPNIILNKKNTNSYEEGYNKAKKIEELIILAYEKDPSKILDKSFNELFANLPDDVTERQPPLGGTRILSEKERAFLKSRCD